MMKKSRSSKTSGLKHFFKLSILCNHMPPHKMQKKKKISSVLPKHGHVTFTGY
jgi:hypothetical protein